jgi:hypothetical protein
MNDLRNPGEKLTPERQAAPDRITLPSMQSPVYPSSPNSDRAVERISVQTIEELKKTTSRPPDIVPTSYSMIHPETEPKLDRNEFITSTFKLHRHLHRGLTRLDHLEKREVLQLLREIQNYLENE